MPNILPPVWSIFTDSVDRYVKTTVNCIDPSEDLVDEDGETKALNVLFLCLLEYLLIKVLSVILILNVLLKLSLTIVSDARFFTLTHRNTSVMFPETISKTKNL